jgi:omega-6 fatty acid desaturase (delta-12 desaturase)
MRSALRTDWPEKKAILSVIPEHCFKKDTVKSLAYALVSVALTLGCGALAYTFIPMKLSYIGAWAAYAIAAGITQDSEHNVRPQIKAKTINQQGMPSQRANG